MANDLTLFSPTFNTSGKYGSSLNGGYGFTSSAVVPTSLPITIEGWFKSTGSALKVAFGQGGMGWIGSDASGKALAHYGNNTDITLSTTVTINDGAWHHGALVIAATGGQLFIDGVLATSSTSVGDFAPTSAPSFGVRALGQATHNTLYDWPGEVDEVAIWSEAHYTASFTPAPVSNTASNLAAIWHLNGDGVNSLGVTAGAATTVLSSGPSSGTVGVASANFSYSLNGTFSGTVVVTPSDGGAGGTFSPATLNVVAGSASTTTYTAASTGAKSISATNNAGLANSAAISYTAAAAGTTVFDATKILRSPGNWDSQPAFMKTIYSGAYFSTLIGGASCTINADLAGVSAPYAKLAYRFDRHGPWTYITLAASMPLSIPSDVAAYPSHFLEFIVDATSEAVDNWSGGCAVKITGFVLDAGKGLSLPVARAGGNILAVGDSITRGINTITNSGDATVRASAMQSWALLAAERAGCEIGIVGFGGQGLTVGGAGNVPIVNSTIGFLYNGVARSFSGIDLVIVNEATNDGSTDVTAAATAFLNNLISLIGPNTKIMVLQPFNGLHGAQWQAAIAACSAPARFTYQSTSGWFDSTKSFDALHPVGWTNIFDIAPKAEVAIRSLMSATAPSPTLTPRTATIDLGDATGALANLSGLKIWIYDDEAQTALRYFTAAGTTNSAGNAVITFNSTLASGGLCSATVRHPDGRNSNRNYAVT